jgi:hypothetical protein
VPLVVAAASVAVVVEGADNLERGR